MDITEMLYAEDRATWRAWLAEHHATAKDIWLVSYDKATGRPSVSYLDAVEEALCFGWIDSIAKRVDGEKSAQRFSPRKPKSNWTELNKDRARRLIEAGLMTEAGRRVLPDLSLDAFRIAPDILDALKADAETWANFQAFPASYQRIRVGYIEEMRRQPTEFAKRLANFLARTKAGKMFGTLR